MEKKGQLAKQLRSVQKELFLRRVLEGLFLSNARLKRGCWSYLIEIRGICHTSYVSFPIVAIRYDEHPLFGPT